jgi:imidazolonepropionase
MLQSELEERVRHGDILIRGARHLLTLRGSKAPRRGSALSDLGVIQDGAILIRDGILAEVGPTRRVENLAEARDAIEVDASGRVVVPGFRRQPHTSGAPNAWLFRCGPRGRRRAWFDSAPHRSPPAGLPGSNGTTTLKAKTGAAQTAMGLKLLRVLDTLKRDPLDVLPTFLLQLSSHSAGPECRSLSNGLGRSGCPRSGRRRAH